MFVYLGTIIIILVSGHICSNFENKHLRSYRSNFIVIVSILLILQSGLRNLAVGADTYAYFCIFEDIRSCNWTDIWNTVNNYHLYGIVKDPGYMVLQKLAQYFLPNYRLFLIFIAFIFFSALGNFIYRNTSRLSDAVVAYVLYSCLFFSFFSITGNRQVIATAIALYSFEFIKKKKIIPFLSLILGAFTIHRSVLLFIPLYFVTKLKRVSFYFWCALVLFVVLMVNKMKFFEFVAKWSQYEYECYEGGGAFAFTLMLLLFAVVALWRMKAVINLNKEARPIYMAFIFALIFTPLVWVNPSAMRVVQYFSIFMLVLAPLVINSFAAKTRKIVYFFSLCLLLVLFVKANRDQEYKFFWQEMELGDNYSQMNMRQ